MRKLITLVAVLAMATVAFAAPVAAAEEEPTIFDYTRDRGMFDRNAEDFDVLNVVLRVTGLNRVVKDAAAGPFTVFAPVDQAFKDTATAVCGRWWGKTELRTTLCLYAALGRSGLSNVVLNHILDGEVPSSAVPGAVGTPLETLLAGNFITPTATSGPLGLGLEYGAGGGNTAEIIAVDLMASNGIVHVIDSVMVP